jgi:hypothetical protein
MFWEIERDEKLLEIEEAEMDLAAFGGSYADEMRLERLYQRVRKLDRKIAEWHKENEADAAQDNDQ